MFKKLITMFHIAIIAAFFLTGCGFKGDPVYKEGNKTIDYNSTESSNNMSHM